MSKVRRIYVEKKDAYAVKAKDLKKQFKDYLGIKADNVRVLTRYDMEGVSEDTYNKAKVTIFSEPPIDVVYEESFPMNEKEKCFSQEYLPGQFDQRADSAEQCVKLLNEEETPVIKTATTYVVEGDVTEEQMQTIREYVVNPVDSRITDETKPETLVTNFEEPADAIWVLAKLFLKDKHSVGAFVQGSYRSSAAILGVAFIQNIYGTSGMAPLMIIGSVPLYNIFAVIVLTFESGHDSTDSSANIRRAFINILKNPIIIGIFAGLVASYVNLTLPGMVTKSINNLAVMTSPLALLSIGAGFEGRKALAKLKPTFVASFMKLLGWAGIFLPIAVWLGFRDQELIALLIMLASPCTPAAYIMAKNMDGDDILASSIVVATTLLSSVTLTFWIFVLRMMSYIH